MSTMKRNLSGRPSYHTINPLGFWISMLFVPFNILLGLYLYYISPAALHLPLLHTFGWAAVYVIIGLWLALALYKDNIKAIRMAMLCGVFVKIYFMGVLLIIAKHTGFWRNLSVIDLWGMVALVQALVFIFFVPKGFGENGRSR